MFSLLSKGIRSVATGGADKALGLRSPHLPGAIVRIGRFLYGFSALWLTTSWYVGFANARTPTGGGPHLVLGGPATNTVDRGERTPAAFRSSATAVANAAAASAGAAVGSIGGMLGGGTRVSSARIATACVGRRNFQYSETRPYPNALTSNPCKTDCSGFVTLIYKAIGAADPNHSNYNGYGNTDTLQEHGVPVARPNIGDLAFWSNPDHVAIVVGTGNNPPIVEFGAPPTPIRNTMSNETKQHQSFIGFRSYL